ncbi:tripartite tricarboxylate transporter substrate binding protein [Ottowia thiooxydans]|uniref:Tripartite-type tricarboxylate transporter receptor subunit TctC n=1 Tax=Ottowia thiooxydans TaxID=219182 RepID=A0ABV2QI07_9BURK
MSMQNRRVVIRSLSLLLASSALLPVANANSGSDFPNKPIRLTVPFAPGGGADTISRFLGVEMGRDLGQPIVVENKPGAGTLIGTDFVAKAKPDGYNLVIATFAHAVNPALQAKLPYGSNQAFAPVMLLGRGPNVLVVRAESPIKNLEGLLADAKSRPGKLTYASPGNGTSPHLSGEMFAKLSNSAITHVPYRGAGPALNDLLGGQVDMMFATAAAAAPMLENGKLRALGVTTAQPSPAFKNVPAIATRVPGYVVESWYGLYVPAGTPASVIARLNKSASSAARSPGFAQKVAQEGLTIDAGPPAELDAYVAEEEKRWSKFIKDNRIQSH